MLQVKIQEIWIEWIVKSSHYEHVLINRQKRLWTTLRRPQQLHYTAPDGGVTEELKTFGKKLLQPNRIIMPPFAWRNWGRPQRISWRHFTVSDSRLPQPGGPGPRIYNPQKQGGPVIHLDTGSLPLLFRHYSRIWVWVSCYDRRSVGQSILE
jgi:hypothetical protein